MSSIRPLAELKEYWPDCGQSEWNLRLRRTPAPAEAAPFTSSQRSLLSKTIESEIIPRLMLAYGDGVERSDLSAAVPPTSDDVEEFVRLLLSHELFAASSFVSAVRARGTSLDVIYLSLFAPAARYLGELWKRDICDFTDVTIALSRLQHLLRDVTSDIDEDVIPRANAGRVFLTVAPGDQHTFGLNIVQEFFRRAGWQVFGDNYNTTDELVAAVQREPFDLIGLSITCDAPVSELSSLVHTIKKTAVNPAARVMVGGRFFLENPELVACIGADSTAPDGRRAVSSFQTCLT